jgi:hypothetical protein
MPLALMAAELFHRMAGMHVFVNLGKVVLQPLISAWTAFPQT